LDEFEKEKIAWQRVTKEPMFCIAEKNMIILDSMAFMTAETSQILRYCSAFLNSKAMAFYIDSISHQYSDTGYLLSNQYAERLPIAKIPEPNQKPFEILVDYIIFAKANALDTEANFFESVIDVMVYGLYFEESMKKADCFINDEVKLLLENCADIKEAYKVFKENKTVMRGLTYSRTVEEVKIINGAKDD
jgi:hypothetical protein